MSYLDLLPIDIYIYIIQRASTDFIIDQWYFRIQKKIDIIYLIINIKSYIPNTYFYDPTDYRNSNIFKYTSKILSGKEDFEWWYNKIICLANGIYNCPCVSYLCYFKYINYNKSISSCLLLADKFNIRTIIDDIISLE